MCKYCNSSYDINAYHNEVSGASGTAVEIKRSTSRERLYANSKRNCDEALRLMERKNSDYSHGDDPYRNFRRYGPLGFLVRLSDKIARLDSYMDKGSFAVASESLKDTIQDIINYANLLHSFLLEEAGMHEDPEKVST